MAHHPELACGVCFHPFDTLRRRPVDLGCGHTYCDACLLASPVSFRRCPECRASATNPHVNYTVHRLLSASGDQAVNNSAGEPTSARRTPSQPPSDISTASPGLQALQLELSRLSSHSNGPASSTASLMGFIPGLQWLCTMLSSAWSEQDDTDAWQQTGRHVHSTPAAAPPASWVGSAVSARPRTQATHRSTSSTARASRSTGRGAAAMQDLPVALQEVRSTFWSWMGPLLGVLYMLSPLDLIPDFLPLVGWLDDMLVLGAVIYFVYSLVREQQIIRDALGAAAAQHS